MDAETDDQVVDRLLEPDSPSACCRMLWDLLGRSGEMESEAEVIEASTHLNLKVVGLLLP